MCIAVSTSSCHVSSTSTSLLTELGSSRQLAAPFRLSSSLKFAAHIPNTSFLWRACRCYIRSPHLSSRPSILSSIPCHLEYHIFATVFVKLSVQFLLHIPPCSVHRPLAAFFVLPYRCLKLVGGCSSLSLMPNSSSYMHPASSPLPSLPLPSTILGFCFSVYLLSPTFCHTVPSPLQWIHRCTASSQPPLFPSPRLALHTSSLHFLCTLPSSPLALPRLHITWSHCPILLPLLHADLKDDRFVLCGEILFRQPLQSFTLLSWCCCTTSKSSSVLCRPVQ